MFRLLTLLCAIHILGCGADDIEEHEPIKFVSASPPFYTEIATGGTIKVTFDGKPTDVHASEGTVAVAGKTATITGPVVPPFIWTTITQS